jgi:hypothetical protein
LAASRRLLRLAFSRHFVADLTGILEVFAALVIATMSAETLFGSIDQVLEDAWALIRMLWLAIALPFALCVLPGAVIQ